MNTKMKRYGSLILTALSLGVVSVWLSGASCKSSPCEIECPIGLTVYICKGAPGGESADCYGSQSLASFQCLKNGGATVVSANCESDSWPGTGGESGGLLWEPELYVSYDPSSDKYRVDSTFASNLQSDGFTPLNNDSARISAGPLGYPILTNVTQGDLADLLGFQSGDVILTVNNVNLSSPQGWVDTYLKLQNETEFVVEVQRGTSQVVLRYELA